MRLEFKSLMDKWMRDADKSRELYGPRSHSAEAIEVCIEDLKDTLLLIEANDIAKPVGAMSSTVAIKQRRANPTGSAT